MFRLNLASVWLVAGRTLPYLWMSGSAKPVSLPEACHFQSWLLSWVRTIAVTSFRAWRALE